MLLVPFIPFMKNGLKFVDKILKLLLYLGKRKRNADLLTGLFIFTGLVDKEQVTFLKRIL